MIVHTMFNNLSEHGYKSSVLKSGICKYTRRDEAEKMKWCVMEMAHFGYHPKGGGLLTNLINRLKILIMEELSFHDIDRSAFLINLLHEYDKDRSKYGKLLSFCEISMKARKNRAVSYMNSWWRHKEITYEKDTLDKVLRYKKKNDCEELLLAGENMIHFIDTKDERLFGCLSKMTACRNQGTRFRRKDGSYLWFEILQDYMTEGKLPIIFNFALEQFFKKNMIERFAFAIWIGLIVWKRDILSYKPKAFRIYSDKMAERYMYEMTKLPIDDPCLKIVPGLILA